MGSSTQMSLFHCRAKQGPSYPKVVSCAHHKSKQKTRPLAVTVYFGVSDIFILITKFDVKKDEIQLQANIASLIQTSFHYRGISIEQ